MPTIVDRIVLSAERTDKNKVEGVILIRLLDRGFRIAFFNAAPKKDQSLLKFYNGHELLAVRHSLGTVAVKPLSHLWRETTHTIPRTARPKGLKELRAKEKNLERIEEMLEKTNDLIDLAKLRTRTNRKKHA